jgi:UTP--glucose-1-phosphate uridylyltransferase
MLVLVDKPVIQYGVEEALQSGVSDITIVTSRGKSVMEDHFDVAFELETVLERRGKTEQLDEIRKMAGVGRVSYVRQSEPLGLGHAVLVAKSLVGDEPFGVILSDDVVDANPPALKQLIDVYARVNGPVIAVEAVPLENVSSYGVVAIDESADFGPGVFRITDLVEKPPRHEAPSNLAIIGRYVLTPKIFDKLEQTQRGAGGEIQLTDAIQAMMEEQAVYAYEFEGTRYDAGTTMGWLKASVELALQRPELSGELRTYLSSLQL